MALMDGLGGGGLPGMGFSLAGGPTTNVGGARDMNVYGPSMGASAGPAAAPGSFANVGVSGSVGAGVGSNAAGPAALALITVGLAVLYMSTRRIQGSR